MSDVITTDTVVTPVPKEKKVKKSNIVDEGLKSNLTTNEITQKVLISFPEATEKSIRNLISVRRARLKKDVTSTVQE